MTYCRVFLVSRVLVRLVQNQVRVLVHQFLHRILYKLVEGIQLLSNKTLFIEEGGDDGPTILLGELLVIFFVFFVFFFVHEWYRVFKDL